MLALLLVNTDYLRFVLSKQLAAAVVLCHGCVPVSDRITNTTQ